MVPAPPCAPGAAPRSPRAPRATCARPGGCCSSSSPGRPPAPGGGSSSPRCPRWPRARGPPVWRSCRRPGPSAPAASRRRCRPRRWCPPAWRWCAAPAPCPVVFPRSSDPAVLLQICARARPAASCIHAPISYASDASGGKAYVAEARNLTRARTHASPAPCPQNTPTPSRPTWTGRRPTTCRCRR